MFHYRNGALQYLIIVFDSRPPPPYYAPLMSTLPLPPTLDLTQLDIGEHCYTGVLDSQGMQRLAERAETEGPIEVYLKVAISGQGGGEEILVSGRVSANAVMQCERCLGKLQTQLTSDFQLTVVESEEAADALPMEATPVIAIKGELSVTTLVEDELLLAVPIVALHEEENCPGIGWQTSYEKPHPMAVLAELKEQQDK